MLHNGSCFFFLIYVRIKPPANRDRRTGTARRDHLVFKDHGVGFGDSFCRTV